MFKRLSVFLAFSLAAVAQVHGAGLPVPTVEYSADRVIESEAGTFTGKVYSARDRERMETEMGGMRSVMILRRDKQIGWMLMPFWDRRTEEEARHRLLTGLGVFVIAYLVAFSALGYRP